MKLLVTVAALLLTACEKPAGERPIGKAIEIETPLGLPPLPVPSDNPMTAETVKLGEKLFFDTRLSGDSTVSCSSCHNPWNGFGDGRKTALGMRQQIGGRNAPTVLNAAYNLHQFWDGRAMSLEDQALGPIANPIEMNVSHNECADRLNGIAEYRELFAKAFGEGEIQMVHVQKALAAYERTVISGNSAFDEYQYGGVKSALSESAVRGLAIFMDREKGNCATCHLVGPKSALFTDGLFHNLGAGLSPEGEVTDLGRFSQTKQERDKGAFKTPSLRNVAQTGPYMHDGSLKTLRAVVEFYVGGGSSNPNLDKQIKPSALTGGERDDLVAFLESLTGRPPRVQ
jgi:cytochrome c peroxidase